MIMNLGRRDFLARAGGAALVAGMWPGRARAEVSAFRLAAAPSKIQMFRDFDTETAVWSYNGRVPGPEIRVRQGDRVRVAVKNDLAEETTVHWHGVRVPNAMDGVPHLTQKPIAVSETFVYEFEAADAGTFWYHPHQRSFEQVERGLYGPLIVEERHPPDVDRDVTWVLDDWRLQRDGQISGDFGSFHDAAHNGRVGNIATINGRVLEAFDVTPGERVRLRLINAANARIFALTFTGHRPVVIALDGQPVAPHEPPDGRIVLGPAMRADIVLDMTAPDGSRHAIMDTFYSGLEYRLVELAYGRAAGPSRRRPGPSPLPANPVPEPDLARAKRHEIVFGGGMMGRITGARVDGTWRDVRDMMREGLAWSVNGIAMKGHVLDPVAILPRGSSHILSMKNDTAWHHPIHFHGHSFRVIARNGKPTRHREWQDTVLMSPGEHVEIAFVADNPGEWMFHCHILEHQAAGMMSVIRVR